MVVWASSFQSGKSKTQFIEMVAALPFPDFLIRYIENPTIASRYRPLVVVLPSHPSRLLAGINDMLVPIELPNNVAFPEVDGGTTIILCHRNVNNPSISSKQLLDDVIIEVNWKGDRERCSRSRHVDTDQRILKFHSCRSKTSRRIPRLSATFRASFSTRMRMSA
ncbi:hypothetical protein [Dehalogenimonas formicexedens]|uniref:hypothetical protein n=1 Tax=Dehalogenimonas formicexedens TaxID=1839801 RepID=UPI0011AB33DA